MTKSRTLITAALAVTAMWIAGGVEMASAGTGPESSLVATQTGCTPKREAASKELFDRKAKCALADLDRSPEQMVKDCVLTPTMDDFQNIWDIFVGAQQAAVNAGAQLPHAQPGLKPTARDGG